MTTIRRVYETYDLLKQDNDAKVLSLLTSIQRRIVVVEDYQLIGTQDPKSLKYLYADSTYEDYRNIVQSRSFDHTMFSSIDEYCLQKFPESSIRKGLSEEYKFEVHGILPQHFVRFADFLGFSSIKKISFQSNPTSKRINFLRPEFFDCTNKKGEKVFVVAVGCGHDYVLHYASMLRHILDLFTVSVNAKIVRYPLSESALPVWTGLNARFIGQDEIIILGYIDEIEHHLQQNKRFKKVGDFENEYYVSLKYQNSKTGTVINLLGVKFSFWGDISAKIVAKLCQLGACEIIYVGKLGSLRSPDDIYKNIFAPSKFLILYHDKIVGKITDLRNNFLEKFPAFDTGFHVSVPTVIEEDYIQRKITDELSISSIDNEISQMALAVKKFNEISDRDISFSSLHFATDYVRRPYERVTTTEFDMSNNRSEEAVKNKREVLNNLAKILISYLEEK